MEGLVSYIIRLENFENSREWAEHAYNTGSTQGWNLKFFEGVDGRISKFEDHNISIYNHKKCNRYMERPGTRGCFLSHWKLWNLCVDENMPMAIFEHDVEFYQPIGDIEFQDVIKFEGFKVTKPIPPGQWWEGARAYAITPQGAKKILSWIKEHGAMPADWMLCDGIVDIVFDHNNKVGVRQNQFSFTKDLQ